MYAKSTFFFCSVLVLGVVGKFGNPTFAVGQDTVASLASPTTRVVLTTGTKGPALLVRPSNVFEISPIHSFLKLKSIQDEIELTEPQKLELIKAVEKAEKALKSSIELGRSRPEEGKQMLSSAKTEFDQFIETTLLQHQLEGIKKIESRIRMRVNGVEKFLMNKPFELSAIEDKQVKEVLRRHREKARKQATQIKQNVFEKTLKELPFEKREDVLSKYSNLKQEVPFLHLIAQLENIYELEKLDAIVEIRSGLDAIRYFGLYTMCQDGSFEFERFKGAVPTNHYLISGIIQHSQLFPESSRNEVAMLRERQQVIQSNQQAARIRMLDQGLDPEVERKMSRDQAMVFQDEMLDLCKKLVEGPQKEPFIDACIENNVMNSGLFIELINGSLAKRLDLSWENRESLRKIVCHLYQKTKQEVIELETQLLSDLAKAMETPNRELFEPLIDWRPKSTCPDMYLFLRSPDDSKDPTAIFFEW